MSDLEFTIFTATYNRAYCIMNVYKCLCEQSYKNFEWIVVDDGSTDETSEIINQCIAENKIQIQYLRNKHGGKHVAHNTAVLHAKGEFFLPLDSDDRCIPETLEILHNTWINIPEFQRKMLSGIGCQCMSSEDNSIVGDYYPKDFIISNDLEMYFKYKVKGEKWGTIKTAILKQYLFPIKDDVTFITENVVWFQIAKRYNKLYINTPLRYYEVHSDSLTIANKTQNAKGNFYSGIEMINNWSSYYIKYCPLRFLRTIASCMRQKKVITGNCIIVKDIKPISAKILSTILIPIVWICYKR